MSLIFAVVAIGITVIYNFSVFFEVVVFLYFDLDLDIYTAPIFPDCPKNLFGPKYPFVIPNDVNDIFDEHFVDDDVLLTVTAGVSGFGGGCRNICILLFSSIFSTVLAVMNGSRPNWDYWEILDSSSGEGGRGGVPV